MSTELTLLLIATALVLSIYCSSRLHINAGLFGWCFAYIIGCLLSGIKPSELLQYWPTETMLTLMTISLLISMTMQTGAISSLTDHLLYACRNVTWFLIPTIFLLSTAVSMLGAQSGNVMPIVCSFSYPIAYSAGLNPLLVVMASFCGVMVGTQVPWNTTAAVLSAPLRDYFSAAEINRMIPKLWVASTIDAVVVLLIFIVICKGFRKTQFTVQKPTPMTSAQKQAIAIFLLAILWAIVPGILNSLIGNPITAAIATRVSLPATSLLAVCLMALLKLGDFKKAMIHGVPWDTIFLMGGMITLISVAVKTGATDLMIQWVSRKIPSVLYAPAFVLLSGILSLFVSGGLYIIYPLMAAVAIPLAMENGTSALLYIECIVIGTRITSISPFSVGGSLALGLCDNEAWTKNNRMFKQLLLSALGGLLISAILALFGLFPK